MIQTSASGMPRPARGSRRGPRDPEAGLLETPAHLRDRERPEREREAVHAPGAAAPLHVLLVEHRQTAAACPGARSRRSVRWVVASREPESVTRRLYSDQRGRSGTRSIPNTPPRRSTRATLPSVVGEIPLARQRLQHAVGRHHQAEARTRAERQPADVAAHEADAIGETGAARLQRGARPSIASDRSIPTSRAPDLHQRERQPPGPAAELEHRPRTARRARPRQNATSRRATVRAFSQS